MCGIAGIVSLDLKSLIDVNLLRTMTQAVYHRGPDDEGYLLREEDSIRSYAGKDTIPAIKKNLAQLRPDCKSHLGFGFRRLAILDLSEQGHQPMSLSQYGLHIVFNGEIYNWKELREELTEYVFRSNSDTEVILCAYHKWGKSCVSRFIGMWAFALWDENRKELFCSRDRFGIKPFYYTISDQILYFGSELKQLVLAPINKNLNHSMILRSMKINAMLVYGEETFWNGIKVLRAGENLICKGGSVTHEKYYALDVDSFESSTLSLRRQRLVS